MVLRLSWRGDAVRQPDRQVVSARTVVCAEKAYTRLMVSAIRWSMFGGALLFIGHAAMSFVSSLNETGGTVLSAPGLTLDQGGGALLLLVPLALALQVLVRLPRDPDTAEVAAVVAHRQFWGSASVVVGTAAVFVGVSSFWSSLFDRRAPDELDAVGLFGVPLGALAVLVLTSDVSAVTKAEAERYNLLDAYKELHIDVREKAIERIGGRRNRAGRAIAWRAAVVGIVATALCGWGIAAALERVEVVAAYAVLSLILVVLTVGFLTQHIPGALQGATVEAVLTAVMLAGMFAVSGMPFVTVAAARVNDLDNAWAYVPAMAAGFAIAIPPAAVAVSLLVSRRSSVSPLMGFAANRLEKEIVQIRERTPPADWESWMTYAWASILTCVVPAASVPLLSLAWWHRRRGESESTSKLFGGACVVVVAGGTVSVAFVLLLPVAAVWLGWASA